MSTDPTQPKSPRERDGARPEAGAADQTAVDQTAVERPSAGRGDHSDAAQPDPAQSSAVPPTRVQPAAQPVPPTRVQPTFQPAQPTFQPAQPPQPTFQPAQPDQPARSSYQAAGWPEESFQPAGQEERQQARSGWPEQPPRDSSRRGSRENAYPGYPGTPPPRRRRRARRWVMALFALIVAAILLTIGDRVALAIAENDFADQAVANGMPVKPSVTIEGFPFLTQLVARDFRRVDISASNVPAGPVDITSVKATLTGMHLNSSFSGATVDHINATAFISFSALASAGGVAGVTMSADGPGKVKITAGIGPLSDTEVAKISQVGQQKISVQVLNSGSPLSGLLSSFGSFSFSIPKLPASVHITNVSITPQGLSVTAAADHANLTKPSS